MVRAAPGPGDLPGGGGHARSRAALAEAAAAACARAAPALLALQKPEGYWVGDLLADSTLESDYVLLQLWLHPPRDGEWNPPTWERHPRGRARPSWTGSCRTAASTSIRTAPPMSTPPSRRYIALKLAGLEAASEPLQRARDAILGLGGIQAANSYVKINLSLFGLYPQRARAHHPAGAGPAAGQPDLRDVVVDARDRGAAVHRPGASRTRARCRRASTWTSWWCRAKTFKLPKRDRLSRRCSTSSTAL